MQRTERGRRWREAMIAAPDVDGRSELLDAAALGAARRDLDALDDLLWAVDTFGLARRPIRRLLLDESDADEVEQDVLVALTGCAPGGGSESTGPASLVRPAPGTVSVEVFGERSEVRTESLDVGQSSVEVRIDEILSEFDTVDTPEGSVITLPEPVLFDFDSAALKAEASRTLDRIAEALALAGDRRVTIRGHTDARGDDAYNLTLSQRRADAVRDYFVATRTLDSRRFSTAGLGESTPVAPNQRPDGADDPDGRQQNRRVEIVLEGPR